MKTLLAVVIATVVVTSAYSQGTPGNGQPVGPKTTGPGSYSPANSPFKKWTTKQLHFSSLSGNGGAKKRTHNRAHDGNNRLDQHQRQRAVSEELRVR